MSRADKQLRRKRRKERKLCRSEWSNRTISDFDRDVPSIVNVLEYEITVDRLELPGEREPDLEAAISDRRQEIFERVHSDPANVIPELERLLKQFPRSRIVMNWLSSAYQRCGRSEESDVIIKRCHEIHPDYLFARTNLAVIHLEKGEISEAEAIMDKKWDLKLMYPDRNIFHISEFVAMAYVAVQYYMQIGQQHSAEIILDSMIKIAPEHEGTKLLQKRMANFVLRSLVSKSLDRLARLANRPRRKAR
jgi:tetratricopeptide (TPR) repeat protein